MDNKEKYHNFIVNDLVMRTHLHFSGEYIIFPWVGGEDEVMFQYVFQHINRNWGSHGRFWDFISEKYGANTWDYDDIWFLFLNRIKWLIERGRENG